jgi:hypothetical protein
MSEDIETVGEDGVIMHDDGTVEVVLAHPVTVTMIPRGGESQTSTIESLTLRRVTGADLRQVGKLEGAAMTLALAARLSGQTDRVIDRLDGADILRLGKVIGDFLSASRPTGPM